MSQPKFVSLGNNTVQVECANKICPDNDVNCMHKKTQEICSCCSKWNAPGCSFVDAAAGIPSLLQCPANQENYGMAAAKDDSDHASRNNRVLYWVFAGLAAALILWFIVYLLTKHDDSPAKRSVKSSRRSYR